MVEMVILSNQLHQYHEETRNWVGGEYDASTFDVCEVGYTLAVVAAWNLL